MNNNKECFKGYILAVESSCDDTAIAIIKDKEILVNIILQQQHKSGVIPEYAARAHHIALFEHAKEAMLEEYKIDLIAYTIKPGLIGSLFVGANFAKSLAYSMQVPSIGIDHLEGHVLLPYWLNDQEISFPYLCLLISGGHTMIILVSGIGSYQLLATTLDDALGEVLDKVARNIGLDYPGGPKIEKLAQLHAKKNNCPQVSKYKFPHVMRDRNDFSFSGLKTCAIEQINNHASLEEKNEFCHVFENHIGFLLAHKMEQAHKHMLKENKMAKISNWVVSGGVAANETIRSYIKKAADNHGVNLYYPPIKLCTDNAVMIACVAQLRYEAGKNFDHEDILNAKPEPQTNCFS